MNKQWKIGFALPATLLVGALLTFAGCESKGPAEQAGEHR